MSELHIIRQILADLGSKKKLFRNNRGMAWAGRVKHGTTADSGKRVTVVYNARPIYYGLPPVKPKEKDTDMKGSDLFGWESVVITEDMVGKKIAQVVAIEVKTLAYDKLVAGQRKFLELVKRDGGQAYIMHERANGGYWKEEI